MGPEELGRYRLRRVLGRGSIGEVWEAQDSELSRRVAVKILRAGDDEMTLARMRFSREARAAAILRHPNVVVVHDAGEAAGTCFIIMELVEGRAFRELARVADIPVADKLRWLRETAEALHAMHDSGIVHRDVKPVNVIVRADGSACLVDLGIAKWKNPDIEPPFEIDDGDLVASADDEVGVLDYLAPEARYAGVFDERGDQYAWAVTACELLTGEHPSKEGLPALGERTDIPPHVVAAIEKARASSPMARFERMADLLAALSSGESPPVEPAEEDPRPKPALRPEKRARLHTPIFVRGTAAVLAVGGIFTAALAIGRWSVVGPRSTQMLVPSVETTPTGPSTISIGSLDSRYRTSSASPLEDQKAVLSAKKAAMEACVRQHPPRCPTSMVVVCQLQHDGTVPSCLSSSPGTCEKRELGACLERAVPMKLPQSENRPVASDFALELVVD